VRRWDRTRPARRVSIDSAESLAEILPTARSALVSSPGRQDCLALECFGTLQRVSRRRVSILDAVSVLDLRRFPPSGSRLSVGTPLFSGEFGPLIRDSRTDLVAIGSDCSTEALAPSRVRGDVRYVPLGRQQKRRCKQQNGHPVPPRCQRKGLQDVSRGRQRPQFHLRDDASSRRCGAPHWQDRCDWRMRFPLTITLCQRFTPASSSRPLPCPFGVPQLRSALIAAL